MWRSRKTKLKVAMHELMGRLVVAKPNEVIECDPRVLKLLSQQFTTLHQFRVGARVFIIGKDFTFVVESDE